jgi:hypothetical protein
MRISTEELQKQFVPGSSINNATVLGRMCDSVCNFWEVVASFVDYPYVINFKG